MRLIPLWQADLHKAYDLQMSFLPDENGFTNPAAGQPLEEFSAYVQQTEAHSHGENLPEGYVPGTVFVLEDDAGNYVGIFNLRHCLNDFLRHGPGHIGYGIRKEYRGRGHATNGLALLLKQAADIIEEEEFYLSVNKDNPASLKAQIRNGAKIHHEDKAKYYTRIPKKK